VLAEEGDDALAEEGDDALADLDLDEVDPLEADMVPDPNLFRPRPPETEPSAPRVKPTSQLGSKPLKLRLAAPAKLGARKPRANS
jgi:hypothetical protein